MTFKCRRIRTRVTQMENRRRLSPFSPHLPSSLIPSDLSSSLISSHRTPFTPTRTHTHSHTISPLSLSSSLTSYLASYLDSLISYPSINIYRRLLNSLKKTLNLNPSQLFFFSSRCGTRTSTCLSYSSTSPASSWSPSLPPRGRRSSKSRFFSSNVQEKNPKNKPADVYRIHFFFFLIFQVRGHEGDDGMRDLQHVAKFR